MSRRNRRSGGSRRVPLPIWILSGILVGVVFYRFGVDQAAAQHPDPRPGVTAAGVLPGSRYPTYPRIGTVYEQARRIPEVLDGLYCHCGCSEHAGHRSLLSCFESDHGAGCDVCLGEAELAFEMNAEGASLREIRDAVDAAFSR